MGVKFTEFENQGWYIGEIDQYNDDLLEKTVTEVLAMVKAAGHAPILFQYHSSVPDRVLDMLENQGIRTMYCSLVPSESFQVSVLIKPRGKDRGEQPMAGGIVISSAIPGLHLIPTEGLVRIARRFETGIERKKEKAWNAISDNQQCLEDRAFIIERIGHVIYHACKLRDKIINNQPLDDDDAGAIGWGGVFLCCATAKMGGKDGKANDQ